MEKLSVQTASDHSVNNRKENGWHSLKDMRVGVAHSLIYTRTMKINEPTRLLAILIALDQSARVFVRCPVPFLEAAPEMKIISQLRKQQRNNNGGLPHFIK